ncbi:MAG: hypothetical protein ABIF82_15175 [Planctomycetota bacterium]
MRGRLLYTSLAAGLIAIVAQSLIIRELVIAFLGNELVIGVTLGAWLLWTGIGSATFGRLGERARTPATWLAGGLIALAVFLPLTFFAAGHARAIAGLEDGEIAGPVPVIVSCLTLLCPLCLANGSIFPTLCRAVSSRLKKDAAVARVYVWEAIGSVAGGVLFTAAIIQVGQPKLVIGGCSLLAFALMVVLRRKWLFAALVWAGPVAVGLAVLPQSPLEQKEHINTIYGRTSVRVYEETVSVFQNGMLSATYPPAGTSESLVHLAMLQVDAPRRVLLVGGLSGTAGEALKYENAKVDILELDPDAVGFVRGRTPRLPGLDDALRRGRARIVFEDGRRYVALHGGEPYDAIILSLPKPVTAQINRYYTAEFFRAASRILSDGGVLAFSVESAPNVSTPELRDFIACLRRTLASEFAGVVVVPGDFNIFVAAKQRGQLTLEAGTLLARLDERKIETEIFDATVEGDLTPFKVAELRDILGESKSDRVNTDLHPISYSHGLSVWAAKERTPRSGVMQRLIDVPVAWLSAFAAYSPGVRWLIGLSALAAAVALVLVLRPGRSSAAGLAVACSGFTEITVEIIALLAFQALYGYVYAMLGLILASFMAGLCAGGLCASRIINRRPDVYTWLVRTQWGLVVYPLVLIAVIWGAGRTGAAGRPVVVAFLALTFVAGLAGGMQFPLAASVAGLGRGAVAGRLSALDLCGAAFGAILVSTLLIPTLGFVTLAVMLAGLGLVALAALQVARAGAR